MHIHPQLHTHHSTARDMTQGSIVMQLVAFSLPLMLGNIFQMLYNTVDSVVVGNFVGTEALAAVGSTTMIVNIMVFFFNGFATGASVVIAGRFGARDNESLHTAIQTTMAATFILAVLFTVLGLLSVDPMLRLMATPDDVFDHAALYLRIYIGGFSGLVIYNMCSGILRAVGDTTRPLYFLVLTSVLNIVLDLFFVLNLKAGIAGVAYATIISQFISAGLTLVVLTCTKDVYRMDWRELKIDRAVLGEIIQVGLPAGIQSIVTAVSNVFVQSYINVFGSLCMAGWSAYNKLDQFVLLPMQSFAMASTTFVSQNMGASQEKRVQQGTVASVLLSLGVTGVIVVLLMIFAAPAVELFTPDKAVVDFGVLFIRANLVFLLFNCVNHVLAGALRGMGDSTAPMLIMLLTFVGIRQVYLFVMTHYIVNTPLVVGLGYPLGWVTCCITEVAYYFIKCRKRKPAQFAPEL